MAVSLDQFTKLLTDSGLMSVSDLNTFTDNLPDNQKPTDAELLARKLVEAKKLTPFQATEIWKGNTQQLVLGDYVILEKLGAGGMGEVYKARHRRMKRLVALKLLPASVTKNEQTIQRFEREVEAAAKLSHPNIVTAHDAREDNGITYLVMENVEGSDLSAIVRKQGPATVEQSINCILQAARGLEYAHQEGVIHRDIKPANLLFDQKGTVKILDMGLARIDDSNVDQPTQAELTGTGTIMGTIDYMAPEQALDTKHADAKSDIYSLGASLHYLLLGKPIIQGDTIGKKMQHLLTMGDVGTPSLQQARNDVPASLDSVFRKMVAKDVTKRYQTMTDVIAALEAIQSADVPVATASSPGIQPAITGADVDSGMASFLNNLEGEKAATDQTVIAPVEQQVVLGSDTFADSSDQMTQQRLNPTKMLTREQRRQSYSKYKKSQIIGSVVAVLVIGALIWSFSGDESALQESGEKIAQKETGTQIKKKESTSSSEWITLFNGVDLSGWQIMSTTDDPNYQHEPSDSGWEVRNGEILCVSDEASWLKTNEQYDDFILQFEFKLPTDANSGIYIRSPGVGHLSKTGMEIQVIDDYGDTLRNRSKEFHTGSIAGTKVAPTLSVLNQPNQWNEMQIECESDRIHITLNGTQIVDTSTNDVQELAGRPRSGFIGIANWKGKAKGSSFRNIRIRKFDSDRRNSSSTSGANSDSPNNYALKFDGKSNSVELPIAVKGSAPFTVEARVVPQSLPNPPLHFNLIDGYNFRMRLHQVTGWNAYVLDANREPSQVYLRTQDLKLHKESHLACVWDGKRFTIYSNGTSQGDSRSVEVSKIIESDRTIYLGGTSTHQLQKLAHFIPFHGLIDEVRISKVARYTEDFTPQKHFEPDEDTLALYHFDSGNGDVLVDSSGNGHDGKIVGAKWVNADGSPIKKSATTGSPPPLAIAPFGAVKAKAHQRAWAEDLNLPVEKEVDISEGEKMSFILIPPGEFMMGSSGPGSDANETPAHRVRITKPFFVSIHEVTVGQFRQFVEKTGYKTDAELDGAGGFVMIPGSSNPVKKPEITWQNWWKGQTRDHPVVNVSWNDAVAFCNWLGKSQGQTYRLLTDAEFEYTRRAGTTTRHPFGEQIDDLHEIANLQDKSFSEMFEPDVRAGSWNDGFPLTAPVGSFRTNNFGLHDMLGNVNEWCNDWMEPYPSTFQIDPQGPATGTKRVLRGGHFMTPPERFASSNRGSIGVAARHCGWGFRVAMTIDATNLKPTQVPATDPDRAVAEWVLEIGGTIEIDVADGTEIRVVAELPQQEFRIVKIGLNSNKRIRDADLEFFKGLTNLSTLTLTSTGISDAGLKHLAGLTHLKRLYLSNANLTNSGLSHLKGLKKLSLLYLVSTNITDDGLEHLKSLTNLSVLNLRLNQVTLKGIADLQKALPNCKIEWDGAN